MAGEVVELQDSGRRRGAFIHTGKKKLEALKERHARNKVAVHYDAASHQIRIQLPPELDFTGMFHGVDERVPVSSLEFGSRVLDRLLRTY